MQVSNDVRMLLPLLAGILVAKWVADAATHSLYHGLLEVACVPFLPATPTSSISLDLLPVRLSSADLLLPSGKLHGSSGLQGVELCRCARCGATCGSQRWIEP